MAIIVTNATIRQQIQLRIHNIHAIESFDVSRVTDMSNCFENMNVSDIDLSRWDTSNVTNMSYMFKNCTFEDEDYADISVDICTQVKHFKCHQYGRNV
jgi:surface protein